VEKYMAVGGEWIDPKKGSWLIRLERREKFRLETYVEKKYIYYFLLAHEPRLERCS